jgi:hypothetical protein
MATKVELNHKALSVEIQYVWNTACRLTVPNMATVQNVDVTLSLYRTYTESNDSMSVALDSVREERGSLLSAVIRLMCLAEWKGLMAFPVLESISSLQNDMFAT